MKAIWTAFFFLLSAIASAQVSLCHQDFYLLDGNVSELREAKDRLSAKDAWTDFKESKFSPILTVHNELNKGFVNHVYWLAIPVVNLQSTPEALEAGIANAGLYHLECYLLSDPDGAVMDQYSTGKSYDFYHRPINNRHYYFPIYFKPKTQAIIFYRVDMCGNGFNAPLRLVTTGFREKTETGTYLFYAFFCGVLAFVCFFSLIAFFWTKGKIYLYYCTYVMTGTLFFLADGDLDFGWLYPHWTKWALIAPSMYGSAMVFFMLLFMRDFLRLKSTHSFLFKLTVLSQLSLLFLMLLIPISHSILQDDTSFRTFTYFYGTCSVSSACLVQLYCILRRMWDKYKPAYLYGAAVSGVLLAIFIYAIHSFNIFGAPFPYFNYVLWSCLTEITIFSIALLYNYNYNQRKYQEVSIRLAGQQVDFTRQLLEAQESEQKRIAEDLHDELGGNLAVIKMRLQSTPVANEASTRSLIELIDKASSNARYIAHNLMPPEFETTKMNDLLQDYYSRLKQESTIQFYFHSAGSSGHFNKQNELILYRVILELTQNILKHSKATEATVQLVYYDTYLEIVAEDNGKGFNGSATDGIGLKNIRSRVNYLRGKLNIDHNIHGTTVMIKVPY